MAERDDRATVARAADADRGGVLRLVLDVVGAETGVPVEPQNVPAGLVLEARAGGKPVGGLLLERDEAGGSARISWWAVQRSERGAGLGREMLRQAEEWCAAEGLAPLSVRALAGVPSAARLLWTCGFRVSRLDAAKLGRRAVEVLWFEKALSGDGERPC